MAFRRASSCVFLAGARLHRLRPLLPASPLPLPTPFCSSTPLVAADGRGGNHNVPAWFGPPRRYYLVPDGADKTGGGSVSGAGAGADSDEDAEELKAKILQAAADVQGCVPYADFLAMCRKSRIANDDVEAQEIGRRMDASGSIIIYRNWVFLHPNQVAEVLSKAISPPVSSEIEDPRREELARMEQEMAEIDRIAQRRVRNLLWVGLVGFVAQTAALFRLTFWDLSWDIMEPITFFVTYSSLLIGYFFFLRTSRDPSYQDFRQTILSSKRKKLMKKRNFNYERYKELQAQCYPGWRALPHSYGVNGDRIG